MKERLEEMFFETQAREAVESALDDAEFDEVRGVISIHTDGEPYGHSHEFDSYETLYYHLIEVGEREWIAYAPFDGGVPVFKPRADGYVESVMDRHNVEDFFAKTRPPAATDELFAARRAVLPEGSAILRIDLEAINDELIRHLAAHPEKMHDLTSRAFEELIAALFKNMGYDVNLTPATRDGGFDIRAISKSGVGKALTLIECKRFLPERAVGVEIVRGLYGVVESERATSGLIVTTSRFTKGAQSFQDKHRYRMALADYCSVVDFLKQWKK